jgi:hypothetical protein
MAVSEHTLEIQKGSSREAKFREPVDPDDRDALRDIGHRWLEDEGWDRSLWHKFTLTVLTSARLVEVHLG